MSAARVSAAVRTAEASMRRESARLTAAAAAETTLQLCGSLSPPASRFLTGCSRTEQHPGVTARLQTDSPRGEIVAIIEHVLSDRAGEWRVSIVGSHADDNWEMKVEGPAGFERSYTLVGGAGEHEPAAIGNLVVKLLPARKP
jgi:hypothetical protein